MPVVSKQRLQGTSSVQMLTCCCFFSENLHIFYKAQQLVIFTHITSTWTWFSVLESSMLVSHAPSFVEMSVFPQNSLWFKMQTGQQVAIIVACSCEVRLVHSARSFFSFFFWLSFVLMFSNYVHGDYPYMLHSKHLRNRTSKCKAAQMT